MKLRWIRNSVFFFLAVWLWGCTMDKTVGPEGVSYKIEDRYNLLELNISSSNTVLENTSFIRLVEKNYFWALKQHYLEGHGENVFLTKEQFADLLSHGKIDFDHAELGDDGYYTASISFYETNYDLYFSFGTATIKYVIDNNMIKFTAFKDTYNFDPKPWGSRSVVNEIIARVYNNIAEGTEFCIYYNNLLF